jgi:hypothetical protein
LRRGRDPAPLGGGGQGAVLRPRAAAAALAGAAVLAAGPAAPPVKALAWIDPRADAFQALAYQPTECLPQAPDPAAGLSIEIGRAAFRSPLTLGGQAARAGLSCESCHRNGHGNPDFLFPGLSGEAGTADVTSSVMSSHRGDGQFNPKPIPDLSGPKAALKVDQDPARSDLSRFIRGLVVEEFDGEPPPPAVLEGLTAYVRALTPAWCPRTNRQALPAHGLLDDARRALLAANATAASDPATAKAMVAAARHALGLVDERLSGPPGRGARARLRAAARLIAEAASDVSGDPAGARAKLQLALDQHPALEKEIERATPHSLFDPRRLKAALDGAT